MTSSTDLLSMRFMKYYSLWWWGRSDKGREEQGGGLKGEEKRIEALIQEVLDPPNKLCVTISVRFPNSPQKKLSVAGGLGGRMCCV